MELDNYIEKLLEKYFEANTTVAEEKELGDYFAQKAVAPHLEQYRPMFNYFSVAKKEQFTKQVPLNTRKKINYGWISAAAAVVLAFGIYFGPDQYQAYQDRKEAELAYEETKKALNLLAENFGKGTQKMAYLNEFEVARSKVFNEK
ncbi:hypothetical protein L0P88_00255 [Muricauda sp. SCSIO 64092]|uniref:hypothetical protein n=1 Tax=Allomuricauda sp. SCSIO 64092 TaxID=2908842 RepID=UPI001FF555B4|nr:hypothetical protein [Muricauda sp. SCSIO 64092]UOY06997.1 hypothetical protein L0P88_00255 [Muricauda sp. SCSIO 64092]